MLRQQQSPQPPQDLLQPPPQHPPQPPQEPQPPQPQEPQEPQEPQFQPPQPDPPQQMSRIKMRIHQQSKPLLQLLHITDSSCFKFSIPILSQGQPEGDTFFLREKTSRRFSPAGGLYGMFYSISLISSNGSVSFMR